MGQGQCGIVKYMSEEWRDVPGFNGTYSVSSEGRVRRNPGRTSNGRCWKGGILKKRLNQDGYHRYTLYREGEPHYRTVHRIVLESFQGPPPSGKTLALHRDDDRNNNTVGNLYWGTLSNNQQDVIRNGNNFGVNKTHCVNGHEYTKENTYLSRKGHRSCNICRRVHSARQNERRKQNG